MPTIPKLTRKVIQQWTSEQSFQRGHAYFQESTIYDQCRSGMTLKSKCSGTQAPFYRQEVIFNDQGIQSAQCSCPVGSSGHCKHVVALLLTWEKDQQSFHEIENLDKVLATKSQAELIAIIRRLITAQPDLEDLVKLPVAGQQQKIAPPDLKAIRRQLTRTREKLMSGYDEYLDEGSCDFQDMLKVLEPIFTLADDYLSKSDPTATVAICIVICDELADSDMINADQDGDLVDALLDCTKRLGKCLTAINDTIQRQEILRTLFTIYKLDIVEMGGISLSDGIPDMFINQTSSSEKEDIVKWLREVIQKNQERKFVKENFGGLLLELKKDQLDDQSYFAICREMQLVDYLVEHLLKLNRVEEAVQECQKVSDYELIKLADIFVRYKHSSSAEELLLQRAKTSKDERLLTWLKTDAESKARFDVALDFAEKIFWQRPNLSSFRELAQYAEKMANWDQKRPEILSRLAAEKQQSLLLDIYLDIKDIKSALSLWKEIESTKQYRYSLGDMRRRLASSAEAEFPREAIDLYLKVAHSLIEQKKRQSYSEACPFLQKVKALYLRLEEQAIWDKLIAGLRAQYRTLPALLEELKKAKL